METILQHVPAIISALGVILTAWFSYNQYTKNKQTDRKIENWKREEEQKSVIRSDNYAIIYGELWDLLHSFEADRVYIIQPHPLDESRYLSIALEVDRKGISKMKPDIQKLPMSEVAVFARALAKDDFAYYRSMLEIGDKKTRSILSSKGTFAAFIKHMTDGKRWVGNIVCEFTRPCQVDRITAENALCEKADTIGYILPEIN